MVRVDEGPRRAGTTGEVGKQEELRPLRLTHHPIALPAQGREEVGEGGERGNLRLLLERVAQADHVAEGGLIQDGSTVTPLDHHRQRDRTAQRRLGIAVPHSQGAVGGEVAHHVGLRVEATNPRQEQPKEDHGDRHQQPWPPTAG